MRREKKQPAMVFTPTGTFVVTWIGAPRLENETARVPLGRRAAAKMLKEIRNRKVVQ